MSTPNVYLTLQIITDIQKGHRHVQQSVTSKLRVLRHFLHKIGVFLIRFLDNFARYADLSVRWCLRGFNSNRINVVVGKIPMH